VILIQFNAEVKGKQALAKGSWNRWRVRYYTEVCKLKYKRNIPSNTTL